MSEECINTKSEDVSNFLKPGIEGIGIQCAATKSSESEWKGEPCLLSQCSNPPASKSFVSAGSYPTTHMIQYSELSLSNTRYV